MTASTLRTLSKLHLLVLRFQLCTRGMDGYRNNAAVDTKQALDDINEHCNMHRCIRGSNGVL